VADISYTPTFQHHPWVDRVDRVEAAGPNGFNSRFNAIESDLRQLSGVVTEIATTLDDLGTAPPPPTGVQRITFLPMLRGSWLYDPSGELFVHLTAGPSVRFGVANINLPQRARMTTLTLRGEFGTNANVNIIFELRAKLSRVPRRLTVPPAEQEDLATALISGRQRSGPYTVTSDVVSPPLADVDEDEYRYFLTVSAGSAQQNGFTIKLRAVELAYTFDD
jgi:hypothetical protein